MVSLLKNGEKRTIFMLILSALSLAVSFLGTGGVLFDAAWVAVLLCGVPILKGAAVGLVTAFDVKADVLVSMALIASVIIGEIFAAGEVAFIMAVGAYLEERTVAKARAGIEKLARLSPVEARVVRDGEERLIPAGQVQAGDILRVLAGETIAVDGVILKGATSVDQSVMTGESLPVDKGEGDFVQSGTVNQLGTFDMVARKVGEDSSLQRMIRLVESADAGKAKIVGLADRWATWIVGIALASAVITGVVTGQMIRAVTILVVFCPCALVLATPTAIMAGIGNAAKYGILISRGDALERLAGVRRVAFDKTGTLTGGKPCVVRVESCAPGVSGEALLRLAASAELRSEHPLGKAIVAHYQKQNAKKTTEPEAFQLLPGRGVSATVEGRAVFAGNASLVADCGLQLPQQLVTIQEQEEARGGTLLYVFEKSRVLGLIALADTPRPEAAETVRQIAATGTKTVLLTGDAPQAANHIAKIAGITDVRASCRPEDKLSEIKRFQEKGEPVCMVGDGVNDAPALKAAQVGIAMGGVGSDIAIEAADITLVRDNIHEIPHLLRLSRKVMYTIHINLAASMILNFAAILLAITGVLGPVAGALFHNMGSVAVILHSALLLKWRKRA